MNIVDKLTMEYLADKSYSCQNEKVDTGQYSVSDLKFYRKRIINLVRERIVTKSKSEIQSNDDVDRILDCFYESCINKFKIEDYHEIKQAELAVFSDKNDVSFDDITDNTLYKSLDECNELLYVNVEEKTVTLDKFVIKNDGSLVRKSVDYPQLNEINLRDRKLKYKGLSIEKSK